MSTKATTTTLHTTANDVFPNFTFIVEFIEQFVFYGIYYAQTLYLGGAYDKNWNAGFAPIKSSQFVSALQVVAYLALFIGAFLEDKL